MGTTWEEVEGLVEAELAGDPLTAKSSYGISKACLTVYSQMLARSYPKIRVNLIPPGALDATCTPNNGAIHEQGAGMSFLYKCLFGDLEDDPGCNAQGPW